MKKVLVIVPAMAMAIAFTVAPVSADRGRGDDYRRPVEQKNYTEVSVSNCDSAFINNELGTISNSGLNTVMSKSSSSRHYDRRGDNGNAVVNTEEAVSTTQVANAANDNAVTVKAPENGSVTVKNMSGAAVTNRTLTSSNSGANLAAGNRAVVNAGRADSLTSATTIVNSNVIKVK
jgi:hypothetical protein